MNTTSRLTPDLLCARMVDTIRAQQPISLAVTNAMLTEPRHLYVPGAPVEEADAEQAVITKRATTGAALSCASVPSLVATMLDQLQARPGDRILEIGAGTGWNAALLDHLTGPTGEVTTIDVDHDVTAGARRNLDATGHQRVRVLTRDGALGDDERPLRPDHRHRRRPRHLRQLVAATRPGRTHRPATALARTDPLRRLH